ncbi:MAG TPA: T9SS type A sorting domain-containing protein, partial [Ignavibacteriaceae bacterium]|nr:T9SS type A sorting domain-containing protein [Ignavibacteriaceae bacterium]
DNNLTPGRFHYRLKQIDFDGTYTYSKTVSADYYLISDFSLEQNYPNPFNPNTTIKFELPKDGFVSLKIYDILGNEITTLVNEEKPTGRYEINFDASAMVSGVYIYKLESAEYISTKKMLLLK